MRPNAREPWDDTGAEHLLRHARIERIDAMPQGFRRQDTIMQRYGERNPFVHDIDLDRRVRKPLLGLTRKRLEALHQACGRRFV